MCPALVYIYIYIYVCVVDWDGRNKAGKIAARLPPPTTRVSLTPPPSLPFPAWPPARRFTVQVPGGRFSLSACGIRIIDNLQHRDVRFRIQLLLAFCKFFFSCLILQQIAHRRTQDPYMEYTVQPMRDSSSASLEIFRILLLVFRV